MSIADVSTLIGQGQPLILAGDESVLRQLPKGNWVGGTTPYVHDAKGARYTSDHVAVDRLPESALGVRFDVLPANDYSGLATRARPHEYIYLIIPGFSPALNNFVAQQHEIPQLLNQPVLGWVSGARLDHLGKQAPLVFDGRSGTAYDDAAIAAYVSLPPDAKPILEVINVFEPNDRAPVLRVEQDGLSHTHVLLDGKRTSLVAALKELGHDTRWPLMSDYMGGRFNVSFRAVDDAAGTVSFYAPLFAGIDYRFAKPLPDYRGELMQRVRSQLGRDAYHANVCILHHVFAELDGHNLGEFEGTMVFGEIAYILHNQTVVFLTV